ECLAPHVATSIGVGHCQSIPSYQYVMSAIGPQQTPVVASHTSAFGGKADMTIATCPLSWSLLGVKRTSLVAAHMSAFDPKRTWPPHATTRFGCANFSQ